MGSIMEVLESHRASCQPSPQYRGLGAVRCQAGFAGLGGCAHGGPGEFSTQSKHNSCLWQCVYVGGGMHFFSLDIF